LVVVVSGAQLENDVEKYINQHSTVDTTFTPLEQFVTVKALRWVPSVLLGQGQRA